MSPALQTIASLADTASASMLPPPAPHFLVGQDHLGRWVAVETHGFAAGLFRSRRDAIHYARDETRGRSDAIDLSNGRVEFRV